VAAILAYLDPASGSLIVQLILGGVAAAAVTIKLWWQRLLRLLRLRPRESHESEAHSTAND
jgi:O-antigen/teichoic acid export membrane protein